MLSAVCFPESVKRVDVLDFFDQRLEGIAGPYEEGEPLYLKCRSYGGECKKSISEYFKIERSV